MYAMPFLYLKQEGKLRCNLSLLSRIKMPYRSGYAIDLINKGEQENAQSPPIIYTSYNMLELIVNHLVGSLLTKS